MINPDMVLSQIQEGQALDEGHVFRLQKYPLAAIIVYGILYVLLCPTICTLSYALILIFSGNEALIDSSLWPIYTHYPFLAIPTLLLPFFLTYLIWYLEKRDRDTVLVLLPEGLIQYKPWHNESKRRTKVIEYRNREKIVLKTKLSGIALTVSYKDGKQEALFITRKYRSSNAIAQQIISDHLRVTTQNQLSTENTWK